MLNSAILFATINKKCLSCCTNKNSAEVDIAPASGKIHITTQGFTLTAITDAEKTKLRHKN